MGCINYGPYQSWIVSTIDGLNHGSFLLYAGWNFTLRGSYRFVQATVVVVGLCLGEKLNDRSFETNKIQPASHVRSMLRIHEVRVKRMRFQLGVLL
jgi:hypothetical protein